MSFWDDDIHQYKTSRGIPLNLRDDVFKMYSFNEEINYFELKDMTEKHLQS